MTSPWVGLLAGLGGAAESIGGSMQMREAARRKAAQDAFDHLMAIRKEGGTLELPGVTPKDVQTRAALAALTNAPLGKTVGMTETGDQGTALPKTPATEVQQYEDPSNPGQLRTISFDPANDPEKKKMDYMFALQKAMEDRQTRENEKNRSAGYRQAIDVANIRNQGRPEPAPLASTSGFVDRKTGKPILGANGKPLMPVSTQPGFSAVTIQPPGAPPQVGAFDVRSGKVTDTGFGAKETTGSGSASLTPEDRAKMLVQAKLDNETMKQLENKWLAEGKVPGVGAGISAGLSTLHGGLQGAILSPLGNVGLGETDPNGEYQRYVTAQRSYGRLMGNLQSKRYSDTQAEIERSIAGIAARDLPATIEYKQKLRDASINDPTVVISTGKGPLATPTRRATDKTPFTDEQVAEAMRSGATTPQAIHDYWAKKRP